MAAFITIEGGEGAGKTRQCKALSAALTAASLPHILTREPGGTEGAEQIRRLVVEGEASRWSPITETLLFCAARADHAEKKIHPALAAGTLVICDRFLDSTIVYQGYGRGLGEEWIAMLHGLVLGNLMPDLTVILDIDPVLGLERAKARADHETRFEELRLEFHRKVREGFRSLAARSPARYAVIDASADPLAVHTSMIALLNQRLGLSLTPIKEV